jgi:hypothetical protein
VQEWKVQEWKVQSQGAGVEGVEGAGAEGAESRRRSGGFRSRRGRVKAQEWRHRSGRVWAD